MAEVTACGQPNCGATVRWARTARQLDERTGKMTGGRPMMVDWPLPPVLLRAGRPVAAEDGQPVPNLGVRQDQWGSLIVRVLSEAEPLRADEKLGVPHWVTCVNPPKRDRPKRAARPKTSPAPGQGALALDLPGAEPAPAPGLMSDAVLFPRRRPRPAAQVVHLMHQLRDVRLGEQPIDGLELTTSPAEPVDADGAKSASGGETTNGNGGGRKPRSTRKDGNVLAAEFSSN